MARTSPILELNTQENTETKILAILRDAYPDLDCGPGTPVYEMVVRPMAYLWARQNMGLQELIRSVSFSDYLNMAEEDMDRLMNRYFLERRVGKYVEGIVRCTVNGDTDISIYAGEIWEADNQKTYEVEDTFVIKKDDWDDMNPAGDPLHWTTERTDVISCLGRVNTFLDLNTKPRKDGDTYIVNDELYSYTYHGDEISGIWEKNTDIYNPIMYKEVPKEERDYFIDIPVISTDVGAAYNAVQYEAIQPTGGSAKDISGAYFLTATNNGGYTETNYEFLQRAKDELAFRGMCSYKSTTSILRENFQDINEVIPVGMRDPEMIRDLGLVRVPSGNGEIKDVTIHMGGCCDIYIKPAMYYIENGYKAPIGFPLTYNGYKLSDSDPSLLRETWNTALEGMKLEDKNKRGSVHEVIENLSEKTDLTNLKARLEDIDTFVTSGENTSLHTDNLVKQTWPIVVKADITIDSDNPDTDIALAKVTVSEYINSLKSSEAPQIAELAHILRDVGIKSVHIPMNLTAYYLRDDLNMEFIGLNRAHSETSILIPIEDDSLAFTIPDNTTTQISLRTCTWYTNADLIAIKVAKA